MRPTLIVSWFGVGAVAALAVGALLVLHQARPGNDVIALRDAWFAPAPAAVAPGPRDYAVPVSLPDDWRRHAPFGDVGWYRLELDLEVAPNRLWGIYVPGLEMTPEFFLNGALLGGAEPSEPLPRYWNRPLYLAVPNGLFQPGSNRLEIRLAANGHWGRLSEIYVGPDVELRRHFERRHHLRVSALQIIAIVGLMISLFIAALYIASRDSTYGWFALFGLGWTLLTYFVLSVDVPVPNEYWDWFIATVLSFLVVSGSLFTLRFLGIRRRPWERLLVVTAVAGPIVLLFVLLLTDHQIFSVASTVVWFATLLLLTSYPLWLMARAVVRLPDLDVVALCCCYAIIIALAVHDWGVVTGIGHRHDGLLLQFAAAPLFATFGVILVRRFLLALREREDLQDHLEAKVEEKTQEVEAAYRHTKSLELQSTLLAERSRLMRDMHDGIGSQLIGVVSRLSRDDPREREIGHDLRRALDDLRLMIDSLDEVDDDLASVLGLFRHRIQPQLDEAGLHLHWDVTDLPPVPGLGPERVLHFLRMLQEAVTNVVKHANAHQIWIRTVAGSVIDGRPCLTVEIEDDGCGLPDAVDEGRGLRNLRHRARLADFRVAVAATGHGTRVQLAIPAPPDSPPPDCDAEPEPQPG